MISKLFVFLGTFVVFISNSYALWNFLSAFSSMRNSAAEGIGQFASAIDAAYYSHLFFFVGILILFIGRILLLIPAKSRI